jgi:hypothetical protein
MPNRPSPLSRAAFLASLASVVVLTACGGGGGGDAPNNDNATAEDLAAAEKLRGTRTSSGTGTSTPTTSTPTTTTTSPTSGTTTTTPVARTAPDWNNYEAPTNWDYQPVYPSRSACAPGEGLTFNVGPGKTYATPKDVPWLSLLPCDTVNIYYSTTPYKDIIYLASRGRANKWITIQGVAGPNGELPILDGTNAVMPKNTGALSGLDSAAMIIISTPSASAVTRSSNYKPGYLHITGLKIRNARPPQKVTNLSGSTGTWGNFSAGISIYGAEKVAITKCDLGDNGLGIFANSTGGEWLQTRNLLIARNHFHGNGNVGSFSEHNAYTEGIGTVYEYNYFAPPINGSNGDNIKERSAGVIFRYNYIEGGADLIALRDPESNVDYESAQVDTFGEKLVANAFVYSNILVTRQYLQAIVGHGDGGMGTNKQPREGSLYFYNNRVASFVNNESFWRNNNYFEFQPVPLIDLLNTRAPTTVVARNNMLYAAPATSGATAAPIGLFYYQGRADYQSNWTNNFAHTVDPYGGTNLATGSKWNGVNIPTNSVIDGATVNGLTKNTSSPGFVDMASGNFLTTSSSPYALLNGNHPTGVTKRNLVPTADPVTAPPVK